MAKYLTKSWLSGNKCMLFISSQVELFSEVFNKWLTSVWIQALMVSSWMNISAALAKSTGASAEIIWVDVHEKRGHHINFSIKLLTFTSSSNFIIFFILASGSSWCLRSAMDIFLISGGHRRLEEVQINPFYTGCDFWPEVFISLLGLWGRIASGHPATQRDCLK